MITSRDMAFPAGDFQRGMTKLEYFSAMAMQGIMATGHGDYANPKNVALLSIQLAKALLLKLEEYQRD
jgi:hypothetical protein